MCSVEKLIDMNSGAFVIVLQSTGRSHSLSANFQEVLSLMKSHNSKLCAGPSSHLRVTQRGSSLQALRRATSARPCNRPCKHHHHHDYSSEPVAESADELASLILQLEEEFTQLSQYVLVTSSVKSL